MVLNGSSKNENSGTRNMEFWIILIQLLKTPKSFLDIMKQSSLCTLWTKVQKAVSGAVPFTFTVITCTLLLFRGKTALSNVPPPPLCTFSPESIW